MEKKKDTIIRKEHNLGLTYVEFKDRLKESQNAVLFLKEYIESKGLKTHVPDLFITPNIEDRGDYSDDVDLIFFRKNGDEVRVEVKQKTINFTDKDFIYKEIIVNSITGYNSKLIKPDLHILLSKDRKYAAVIDNNNRDKWYLKKVFDRVKKTYLQFFFLETKYVEFIKL